MSFTQELRKEADHIFEACYNHPFIRGIADGTLGKEQLIHYVKQDFEYLNAIIQAYAFGIAKCSRREDMDMLNKSISLTLNCETEPHINLCNVAGVKYEDLQGYPLAPTAQHYTRHMLAASQSGTLGDVIAVTLPCPYIYIEIGERLIKEVNPDKSHPFYEWITFYGVRTEDSQMDNYLKRLDELAEEATEEERKRMKEHFMISCQLEYMFFDMAYTLQDWPVQKECTAAAK